MGKGKEGGRKKRNMAQPPIDSTRIVIRVVDPLGALDAAKDHGARPIRAPFDSFAPATAGLPVPNNWGADAKQSDTDRPPPPPAHDIATTAFGGRQDADGVSVDCCQTANGYRTVATMWDTVVVVPDTSPEVSTPSETSSSTAERMHGENDRRTCRCLCISTALVFMATMALGAASYYSPLQCFGQRDDMLFVSHGRETWVTLVPTFFVCGATSLVTVGLLVVAILTCLDFVHRLVSFCHRHRAQRRIRRAIALDAMQSDPFSLADSGTISSR